MPYKLELSQPVRLHILDHCYKTGRTPNLSDLMQHFSISRERVIEVLDELERQHDIVRVRGTQNLLMAFPYSNVPTIHHVIVRVRGTQNLLMAFPYSNVPTIHHVTYSGGHTAYTVCGLDALGLSYMFPDDEALICSCCPHCGEPFEVRCKDRQVVAQSHSELRIHVGLPFREWFHNWEMA